MRSAGSATCIDSSHPYAGPAGKVAIQKTANATASAAATLSPLVLNKRVSAADIVRAMIEAQRAPLYTRSHSPTPTRENIMSDLKNKHGRFETRAIHAGQEADAENAAEMTPVYFTSTYKQDAPAKARQGYEYSRTSNPTRTALEQNLASLES